MQWGVEDILELENLDTVNTDWKSGDGENGQAVRLPSYPHEL